MKNIGAGTVTITPTVSTIDGNATATLNSNAALFIYSDNTNYFSITTSVSLPDLTDTAGTILTAGVPLAWSAGTARSGTLPQFFRQNAAALCFAAQGDACDVYLADNFGVRLGSTSLFGWTATSGDGTGVTTRASLGSPSTGTLDVGASANNSDIQGSVNASTLSVPDDGNTVASGQISFGSKWSETSAACETAYAPTTLSTVATTTDTGLNCLPANSVIDAVVARVTTTITAACTGWSLGDATTAARFASNNTTLTSGTTTDAAHIGTFNNTGIASATTGTWQAAAAKVRITCAGGNPGAGAIRVIVFYHTWTAPTS